MDIQSQSQRPQPAIRHLASLKVLSRLLGHELHAQSGKTLTLSRDEVIEIQATVDLYIEDLTRRTQSGPSNVSITSVEQPLVGTRN